MVKDELVLRSPVRIFEKTIKGGLKDGEIGILAAPKGLGKTSVLVQIGMDKLLQGKKIIHISFNQHASYVQTWYSHIFDELAKKRSLDSARDVEEELVRNRVLMNFNQEGVNSDVIRRSLKSMVVEGGFKADAIIIDGFDFSEAQHDRIAKLKELAKELGLCVWYSCDSRIEDIDKRGIPNIIKNFEDLVDVVIVLEPKPAHIELKAHKVYGEYAPDAKALRLDTKTLLILEN
jgi:hypothetical protein